VSSIAVAGIAPGELRVGVSRKYAAVLILCGWLGLSLMRILANMASGAIDSYNLTWLQLITLVVSVAAFWMPVAVLVLYLDRSRRGRPLLLLHLISGLAVVALEPAWVAAIVPTFGLARDYLGNLIARSDINVLLYAVIVGADVAWRRLQLLKQREVAAAKLEQTLVDVQLHGLALQLQPHFLFNALQFVAETAHDDLETARRTLRLLRGLVEQAYAMENRVEVTVAEEISFLRDYAEIQKSRFGDRFSISLNVDDTALDGGIPPLLLQPLVENASRHGFARRGSGGHIEVLVKRTRRNELSIVVADDGVGLSGQIREGQGLSVTRRRLERLYGSDAHLALARASDGRTESRIRIPFQAVEPDDHHGAQEPEWIPTSVSAVVDDSSPVLPTLTAELPIPQRLPRSLPFRIAAVWLAIMTMLMAGTYLGVALHVYWPMKLPGLQALFLDEMVGVPFWIALTVLALVAARRLSGRWAIPIHAFLALSVAIAHAALGNTVARVLYGVQTVEPGFSHWGTWDMLVYAALVLFAQSHELGAWVKTKMREEVTLNAEVVKATGRLARFREMQSLLLMSLDDLVESPTMETLDRSVVEFADFLRFDVMGGVE
jgi:hypothetical protein